MHLQEDEMERISLKIRLLFVVAGTMLAVIAPSRLLAQAQTAGIVGVVADASGGVVPNAKVTVTSPALQVPELTTMTDAQGNYKFVELPAPGVYRIKFEAKGFRMVVQNDITLNVGFTAKIDGAMTTGLVTEVVEVTTSGPVVDTISTAGTATLQQQEIAEAPKGLGLQELLPMAAGVSLQGKPDVGDSNLANRSAVITYGVVLQPTLQVEGINTVTAKDADSSVYLDSLALAEVEFKTSGNNAEVGFPGVAQVAVMKAGGNTFHGDVQGDYENPSFQANNITPALAAPPQQSDGRKPSEGHWLLRLRCRPGRLPRQEQAVVLWRLQQTGSDSGPGKFCCSAGCQGMLELRRIEARSNRYRAHRI